MKKILSAALVVSAAAFAMETSAAGKADDAIKQVFAQLDRCRAENDAQCIGELMVEDATFSEPVGGAKIVKGKEKIIGALKSMMGGAPNMKGAKLTNSVENVRMIGEDRAVVDSSVQVAGNKPAEGQAADAPSGKYHTVAVMVRRGDKWLFEDIRSYVVGAAEGEKKAESAPAAKKAEPAPPEKKAEPAPAEKK